MKNKGIYSGLILLVMVAGVAFASPAGRRGSLNDVFWNVIEGRSQSLGNQQIGNFHIQVANMNDHPVRVTLYRSANTFQLSNPEFTLAARETRHFSVHNNMIDRVQIRSVVRPRN